MSDAAVHFSLTSEEILSVHLKGKWQMEADVPSTETVMEQLNQHPTIKRIVFDATALGSWDSNLLIYRVLMEDLSSLLGTAEVYRYDRDGSSTADYQVVIDVTRFDAISGGDAVLTAFWTLTGKDADTPGFTRKSVFRAPVSTTGFPGIVDAQNQALAAFSREIASAIQSLH